MARSEIRTRDLKVASLTTRPLTLYVTQPGPQTDTRHTRG